MAYCLNLFFSERPKDLDSILVDFGFRLMGTIEPNKDFKVRIKHYSLFDEKTHSRNFEFVYHDGTYGDELTYYRDFIPPNKKIAVIGALVTISNNLNILVKQKTFSISRYLRDHYSATLYDPQNKRIITD